MHKIRCQLGTSMLFNLVAAIAACVTHGDLLHAQVQLLHPTANQAPSFEVATIRPSGGSSLMPNMRVSPSNFSAEHYSLKRLIKWAYKIKSDDQLFGGPSWMDSEFFDIRAKASDPEIEAMNALSFEQKAEQSRLMVQSLLAERFRLRVTFKTEVLPVYALVIAKDGTKLKQVDDPIIPQPGMPPPEGAHLPRIGPTGRNQYTATAWTMGLMADWLSSFDEVGNHVVVDETGLKGSYDFVLNGVSTSNDLPPGVTMVSPDESTTSLFTALQKQLGLKLEPRKVPVEVLVIEHVEKPSPN